MPEDVQLELQQNRQSVRHLNMHVISFSSLHRLDTRTRLRVNSMVTHTMMNLVCSMTRSIDSAQYPWFVRCLRSNNSLSIR